jgi:hypothetical protein
MLAPTFNGTTKRITLAATTVTLDLIALHSHWKQWVLAGNAASVIAFGAVGGDIPSIPLYLFLLNGWRIVPQAADHVLTVTNGILEVDGGGDPFVDPAGSYKIRINRETPGIAIGYSSTGGTSLTEGAIADAVWSHSSATTLSDKMLICSRILCNKTVTDPATGLMTVYDDDGVTPYLTAQLYEDTAQTQTYRGQGAEVRGRLT